jgi:hypothetical protein
MRFIFNPIYFGTALIVLDILAAISWGIVGDWRKVGYWTSAACLTACVTY